MDVENYVKCLEITLSNVLEHDIDGRWGFTQDEAFGPALQEAFRRARVVAAPCLCLDERVFMLQS